ncbi:MAG: hypothetical protein AB7P34_04130 [Vicinamibacterales bacterium]
MVKTILCSLAVLVFATTATAQTTKPGGSLTDVTGVWIMLVAGHQIGLELEQKGTVVEGVMLAMGQRILLIGDYVERKLTLKGEKPADGDPTNHGGPGAHPITATMLDDGTFAGELTTNQGPTKWTGERLQPK